jgi:nucleotide-binding universal stress UspA family protein
MATRRRGAALGVAPIVVATDLTPTSTQALVAADARSRVNRAPLIVCHVLPDDRGLRAPLFPQDRKLFADAMDRAAAQRALRAQLRAATGRSDDRYEMHFGYGMVSRAIAALAEETQAALIVIGHGTAGWLHSAFGRSTAEQLARLSQSSLLVVRDVRGSGVVVVRDDASAHTARIAEVEATTRSVDAVVTRGDLIATATNRFASLIVIDDTSEHDDPADIVRRAPCSVLVIRGRMGLSC